MADSFPNSQGKRIVLGLIQTIQENAQYLSEVDGAIGDGDHGINMNKGFTRCKELIGDKEADLSGALRTLGEVLLTEIGGALGPLYGSFFTDMAAVCQGKLEIDKQLFGQMLKSGLDSMQNLGGARVGDKTLLDTLIPAYEAYSLSVAQDKSFQTALHNMAEAAENGKESSRNLIAKVGRASRLGERSRGVLDAGAVSCCLILKSFADSIDKSVSQT
jgi:dihydroxyacetone kinase-like protein